MTKAEKAKAEEACTRLEKCLDEKIQVLGCVVNDSENPITKLMGLQSRHAYIYYRSLLWEIKDAVGLR